MFLPALLIFTVIQVAVRGQTITPVYVQSNAPVTLTCPADDQAATLTWTGPGGTLYVTGTTVEAGLGDVVKPRISARHTGGSYTLTFTEFRSSDTGIYTCTVDGTVDIQMVIVQGVTSASPVYTRQGGTVTLQCPDTGGTLSWTPTSTTLLYTIGTDFNPAIPDDTGTRLSVTRQDGTYKLQISDVQLSDIREYKCSSGVTDTFYHLLIYIPPAFPEIENTVNIDGQNRTTGTEDGSMTLTCNSRGGTPAASVSWIKDGTTLVTSDNAVQYTKVFTRADDRTTFTCQSSSSALASPLTTSVLVYLDCNEDNSYSTRIALICVSSVFAVVVITEVAAFVLFRMRKTPAGVTRNNTGTKQECETRQHSRQDNSVFNQSNQPSTYEDLNLENMSPPSVYEDIQERDQRPSGDNSGGNTYEVLGRKVAPNVYE